MNDEVMKADNHEPDYRKAMLFHSDRADQYAAERDTVVAEAATLRAEVERLRGAAKALEKAASEVSRRGAETGPQWSKLTIAILQTRAALGGKHE